MKLLLTFVTACLFLFPVSLSQNDFLDPDQIQEKSIHIQTALEESKVTIKDSWDHPDLGRLRMGGDVYRDAPVLVPGSTWLSFISQSAIGSWNGSYAPMAIQTIDR